MNGDLFARWVEALRATAHPYTRDVLRTEGGLWSPLGLLANLISDRDWECCRQWHFWRWRGSAVGLPASTAAAVGISPTLLRDLFNLQAECSTFREYADRLFLIVTPVGGPYVAPPTPPKPVKAKGGRRRKAAPGAADLPGLS